MKLYDAPVEVIEVFRYWHKHILHKDRYTPHYMDLVSAAQYDPDTDIISVYNHLIIVHNIAEIKYYDEAASHSRMEDRSRG